MYSPDRYWYKRFVSVGIPREDITDIFLTMPDYLNSEEAISRHYELALEFAQLVGSKLEGCLTVIGTGFPYYLFGAEDSTVPEFNRFYKDEMLARVDDIPETWGCPECLKQYIPEDVRSFCAGCGMAIKPFDVIRSLPDIDVIVVFDNEINETDLLILNELIDSMGSRPPGSDLTQDVDEFKSNSIAEYRPRIDVQLISAKKFLASCQALSSGSLADAGVDFLAYHSPQTRWSTYHLPTAIDPFLGGQLLYCSDSGSDFIRQIETNFVSAITRFNSPTDFMSWYMYALSTYDKKNYSILTSSEALLKLVYQKINYLWEHKKMLNFDINGSIIDTQTSNFNIKMPLSNDNYWDNLQLILKESPPSPSTQYFWDTFFQANIRDPQIYRMLCEQYALIEAPYNRRSDELFSFNDNNGQPFSVVKLTLPMAVRHMQEMLKLGELFSPMMYHKIDVAYFLKLTSYVGSGSYDLSSRWDNSFAVLCDKKIVSYLMANIEMSNQVPKSSELKSTGNMYVNMLVNGSKYGFGFLLTYLIAKEAMKKNISLIKAATSNHPENSRVVKVYKKLGFQFDEFLAGISFPLYSFSQTPEKIMQNFYPFVKDYIENIP